MSQKADLIGISSSLLCLVHCLFFPLLMIGGSQLDLHGQPWNLAVNLLFFCLSMYAAWKVSSCRPSPRIKYGLRISVLLLAPGIFFHEVPVLEYLSWLAALSLITFHSIHWVRHKKI